ncbi:MAG TPA: hypothetical protein VEF04_02105, partial [Blastocatellia bacterium]|nr:hypothetical protein [Blastocatellia bacterium]
MSKNSTLKIAVSVVVLVLTSFVMSSSSGLQQADAKAIASVQNACASVTDDDLIKTINESFAADAQIKDQLRHLNVSVTKR